MKKDDAGISNHYTSDSEEDTIRFARSWAAGLKPGDVVALQGDLGAGKTHFVKGVAQALEIKKHNVQSPTFSLINEYGGNPPLYHFDCYRMESVREALEIGIEEYLYGGGVCIIEWPERVQPLLPAGTIWITMTAESPSQRRITIQP